MPIRDFVSVDVEPFRSVRVMYKRLAARNVSGVFLSNSGLMGPIVSRLPTAATQLTDGAGDACDGYSGTRERLN